MKLLFLLSLLQLVTSYNIDNDYILEYTGKQSNNPQQYSNGRNNNHILLQFLLEAIFICIIGSILGLTLGICISFITSVLLDLPWLINHNSIYIAILSSILVGIISGLYPAMTATKLQPVEALKRE